MVAALVALALAAPARADPAELRRGLHVGVGIGPTGSYLFAPSKDVYGIQTNLVLGVGVHRLVDLRTGVSADASGSGTSYLSVGAPFVVRVNLGSTYSIAVGGSVGALTDTLTTRFYAGPEWTLLAFRFGRFRQFEVELAQGVHLSAGAPRGQSELAHVQSALVLTYLFLTPDP